MNQGSPDDRNRQLRNVVVMALADGSIGQREVALLAQRCAELGLGESELHRALLHGLDDSAALDLPHDTHAREALLVDLIRMMAADGKLEESEKRLFALAAAKMKVPADDLKRLIEQTLG